MARLRTNFVTGFVDNNPLAIGGTTLNSTGLSDLEVVSGSDIAVIVLDPYSRYGDPEIVYVTVHTSSATTATISRAQEGTTAREHILGTRWIHAPVENDWDHGNLVGLGDDDHTIYVLADASRTITGNQRFQRASSTDVAINAQVTGDGTPRLQIDAAGKITWGSGSAVGDTTLYRSAVDTLKTDDSLSVAGGTIFIGTDCSIYRSGADALQTDDSLRVNSTFRADGKTTIAVATSTTTALGLKASADAVDRFYSDASGKMYWGDGTNPVDVNLYRSAVDTLKTDDTLIVNRLDVGANTYAFVPVASIMWTAASTADSGFLMCDGTAYSRSTYSALFARIGTTYGVGDGATTFNVPDIRDLFPMMKGGSTSLNQKYTRNLDVTGSSSSQSLSTTSGGQSADHSHSILGGSISKSTYGASNGHTHSVNLGSHSHTSGSYATESIPNIILNAMIKY